MRKWAHLSWDMGLNGRCHEDARTARTDCKDRQDRQRQRQRQQQREKKQPRGLELKTEFFMDLGTKLNTSDKDFNNICLAPSMIPKPEVAKRWPTAQQFTLKITKDCDFSVVHAVQLTAGGLKQENLNFVCVPTSFHALQLIPHYGLNLSDLHRHPEINFTIHGTDKVDADLHLIKGCGHCLAPGKIVTGYASHYIVISDFRKDSKNLEDQWHKEVPMEVIPIWGKIEQPPPLSPPPPPPLLLHSFYSSLLPPPPPSSPSSFFQARGTMCDGAHIAMKDTPGMVDTGLFSNMAESVG
ncbi:Ribose-5-phosphate isomerase, partial [Galemys pyrenaicus]